MKTHSNNSQIGINKLSKSTKILIPEIHNNQNSFSTLPNERSITSNESSILPLSINHSHSALKNLGKFSNQKIVITEANVDSPFSKKSCSNSLRFITSTNNIPLNAQKYNIQKNKFLSPIPRKKIKLSLNLNSLIEEADSIVGQRIVNHGPFSGNDELLLKRQKFTSNQICLQNYLIKKIKEKRSEINENEKSIRTSLKKGEEQMERDINKYWRFIRKNEYKNCQINSYINDLRTNRENKESLFIKLQSINIKLEDELKKTLTEFLKRVRIADFVHKIFDIDFIFHSINLAYNSGNYDAIKNKTREITTEAIEIYNKEENKVRDIRDRDDELYYKIFLDSDFLNGKEEQYLIKSKQMNNLIVKQIGENKEQEAELDDVVKENNKILVQLKEEVDLTSKEKVRMDNQKEFDQILFDGDYKMYYKDEEIDDLFGLICEIGKIADVSDPKDLKDKKTYCFEVMDSLQRKENMIEKYIEQIEKTISTGDPETKATMKKIIDKRNRLCRDYDRSILEKNLEAEKLRKYKIAQQRIYRLRKNERGYKLPLIKNKNNVQAIKEVNNEEDNYEMLYFSD